MSRRRFHLARRRSAATTALSALTLIALQAAAAPVMAAGLGEHALELPAWDEIVRVITLQDYNTRVVIIGTTLLGLAAGLIGTFLLLRKRALLSDTLSHATLPGIALSFILISALGGDGKNLLGLVAGAAVFSVIGTGCVILIQRHSRLKDDAALGIVLSGFFGLGIALLGLATRMETGNSAGLSSFIYGKTASMLFFDALLIASVALAAVVTCLLFLKEFALICFDVDFAATQGWPVVRLDFFMMSLAVLVTVIGLQAVGLILVVALLIIPPSAARFWTDRLGWMLAISGFIGALSCMAGAGISALMANLPAGAVIVLTASAAFGVSLLFGTRRGLLKVTLERLRLRRKISRENLLRALYERVEACTENQEMGTCMEAHIPDSDLQRTRSWPAGQFRRSLREVISRGWLNRDSDGSLVLTPEGWHAARQVVRNHRLWEAYLISHADTAPGQVDWGADQIEHILEPAMIRKLEAMLPEFQNQEMPASPHSVAPARG